MKPRHLEDDFVTTIHLVCHSHMDVGFQQTAEEYYTNKVREIISSTIIALQENPKRKFSFTEIYFF